MFVHFNSLGHYGTAAGIYYLNFHHFLIFSVFSSNFDFSTIFDDLFFDNFRKQFFKFFLSWIFSLLLRLGKCRGRGWRRGWIRNGQEDALSTSFNHCATRLTSFAIMIIIEGPYGSYEKTLIGQMFKETIYRVSDIDFNRF